MTLKQIPEKLIAFTVYRNGTESLGTADVTLPTFDSLTQTISGAGILGEIDSPTPGHFGSQTVTLNWRTLDKPLVNLMAPVVHALDFRGAQQVRDTATGDVKTVGCRISIRGTPKSTNLGNMAPNASTESSSELEITYIKIYLDGQAMLELDKLNWKYVVNGIDYTAAIRNQLGM